MKMTNIFSKKIVNRQPKTAVRLRHLLMALVMFGSSSFGNLTYLNDSTSAAAVTEVSQSQVFEIKNCGLIQGGATDGTYIYSACANGDSHTSTKLVKTSLSGEEVARSSTYTRAEVGHANAMAYNNKTQKLMLTAWDTGGAGSNGIKDKVRIIDPSNLSSIESTKTFDKGEIPNICYNPSTDQYAASGRLYDSNFKYVRTIFDNGNLDRDAQMTNMGNTAGQGIACNASSIYVLRWSKEKSVTRVVAYSWTGAVKGVYNVKVGGNEVESLFIANNTMYAGLNTFKGSSSNVIKIDGILSGSSTAPTKNGAPLAVGTYNILGYYHGDGSTYAKDRLQQITKNINDMKYDVVGLQEYRDAKSGDDKILEHTLQKLNPVWRMSYVKPVSGYDTGQLNIVYNSSTLSLVEDRVIKTGDPGNRCGSGSGTLAVRAATFTTRSNQPFLVLNVHPTALHSSAKCDAERLGVVKDALKDSAVAKFTGPIFLLGDFNANPTGDRRDEGNIERYLKTVGYANSRDIPSANRRTGGTIDHIYYKTSAISAPSSYETMDCKPISEGDPRKFNSSTTCASDHTPVKAIFDDLAGGGGGGGACTTSLTAAEKERDQTWNNEFWDPTNQCTCNEASASGMTGNTNFKKIVTYLSSKGLGHTAITGIMANFNSESANYSAFRIQGQGSSQDGAVPSSGGYGIAQFTPTTKIGKVLKEDVRTSKSYDAYYTRKYGGLPDPKTGIPEGVPVEVNDAFLEVELDFIYKGELKATTAASRLDKLKRAGLTGIDGKDTIFEAIQKTQDKDGGEKDAAKIFMILYERPGSTMDATWNIGAINARGDMATGLLADVQSAMGIAGNSAAACVTNAGQAGNFAETVKSFAWEDARRVSNQKPDYTAALKGRYKGGNGGNDCGAFVSTLMVKSGFEPDYPGTSTGPQRTWLDKNWEKIYDVKEVDTSKLRAGDVAIKDGHVFVWIGDVEGFVSKSAEAAVSSNTAPTAIGKGNTFSDPSLYTWFRKKV